MRRVTHFCDAPACTASSTFEQTPGARKLDIHLKKWLMVNVTERSEMIEPYWACSRACAERIASTAIASLSTSGTFNLSVVEISA